MTKPPDINAFPANKLGAFLRAMADPEGKGEISPESEKDIATIEARLAESPAPDQSSQRRD